MALAHKTLPSLMPPSGPDPRTEQAISGATVTDVPASDKAEPGIAVSCTNCAAVCCRLEVLLLTDTGVPARYIRDNPRGVAAMERLDDGWCAALDRVGMCCGIYDRRPLICRGFDMGGPDCLAERAAWAGQAE